MPGSPARAVADGVLIDLRIAPGASRTQAAGLEIDAAGTIRLKLRIASPPVDGAANAAVLKFLAKAIGRPKRDVALTQGHKNRSKTVMVKGAPGEILARLQTIIGGERL